VRGRSSVAHPYCSSLLLTLIIIIAIDSKKILKIQPFFKYNLFAYQISYHLIHHTNLKKFNINEFCIFIFKNALFYYIFIFKIQCYSVCPIFQKSHYTHTHTQIYIYIEFRIVCISYILFLNYAMYFYYLYAFLHILSSQMLKLIKQNFFS
jgi:hypothetical protein